MQRIDVSCSIKVHQFWSLTDKTLFLYRENDHNMICGIITHHHHKDINLAYSVYRILQFLGKSLHTENRFLRPTLQYMFFLSNQREGLYWGFPSSCGERFWLMELWCIYYQICSLKMLITKVSYSNGAKFRVLFCLEVNFSFHIFFF